MSSVNMPRTGALVLFTLLVLVGSTEASLSNPVLCYILDGILLIYCIIATALYFTEKFSRRPREAQRDSDPATGKDSSDHLYQALHSAEKDIYHFIDTKGRKQVRKKKKLQVKEPISTTGRERDAT